MEEPEARIADQVRDALRTLYALMTAWYPDHPLTEALRQLAARGFKQRLRRERQRQVQQVARRRCSRWLPVTRTSDNDKRSSAG